MSSYPSRDEDVRCGAIFERGFIPAASSSGVADRFVNFSKITFSNPALKLDVLAPTGAPFLPFPTAGFAEALAHYGLVNQTCSWTAKKSGGELKNNP